MGALTPNETSFLRLLLRSPDQGEGWRRVSAVVWPMVERFTRPEIIEAEAAADGGRVRLSERGRVLVDYI